MDPCSPLTLCSFPPNSWLQLRRPRGDEGSDVFVEHEVGPAILIEAGDDEAGVDLTADLIIQGVTELKGRALDQQALPYLVRRRGQVGIGDGVFDLQPALLVGQVQIEDVGEGIQETGQEGATRLSNLRQGTAHLLARYGVKQAETRALELYHYAFGHPLTSRVILKELGGQDIPETALVKRQPDIARIVAEQVIEERFFDQLGAHGYLEPLLWVVCILRKFNPTPLRYFAAKFLPDRYAKEPGGFYLDAIRDLQDTTLVRWDSAAAGYVLDPVVRQIMAKNLAMRQPGTFREWHEAPERY